MKLLSINDNYIPQLITLGCIMIFSLTVCSIALNYGADGFTAFGLFIFSSLISTALIQSILQDLFHLLIKFPKEERTVEKINTFPKTQLSNYEQYRQDALLAKAEEEQNKINTVLSYTEKTWQNQNSLTFAPKSLISYYPTGNKKRVERSKYHLS